MVNFKPLLLLASTASALAVKNRNIERSLVDASTIIQDIQNIDDGVNALTASLEAYNGGLLGATPITADIAAIHVANRKGFVDANLIAPQNTTTSNEIIDYVFKTVDIDIPNSVKVLESKKADFEAANLTEVVLAGLVLLKNDHDTFSAALLNKTAPDTEARGLLAVKIIDDALQNGIDDFSS